MARFNFSRRSFILSLIAAPIAFASALAWAAKKTVTSTQADASKGLVKEKDAMPAALKYKHKASAAKERTNLKANCSSCLQYAQAVGADGKDILVDGEPVGTCTLFGGGKGFAKSGGWCMSWFQAA